MTAAFLFSLILGIIWLVKAIKFVKAVKREGKFDSSLLSVASSSAADEYEKNKKRRITFAALALIASASIFSLRLNFEGYHGVNLIPPTVYGALLLIDILLMITRLSEISSTSSK